MLLRSWWGWENDARRVSREALQIPALPSEASRQPTRLVSVVEFALARCAICCSQDSPDYTSPWPMPKEAELWGERWEPGRKPHWGGA